MAVIAGFSTGIAITAEKSLALRTKEARESGPLWFGRNVIPGRAGREPGTSRFPDVQLHI
jgi:hypothetical protein